MFKVQLKCRESGRMVGTPRHCANISEAYQLIDTLRGVFHPDSFDVCVAQADHPLEPAWTTEEILQREG